MRSIIFVAYLTLVQCRPQQNTTTPETTTTAAPISLTAASRIGGLLKLEYYKLTKRPKLNNKLTNIIKNCQSRFKILPSINLTLKKYLRLLKFCPKIT